MPNKNVVKLAKTPFGFFAIDEPNQILEIKELPADAKLAAEALVGDEFEKWSSSLKKKKYDIEEEGFDPLKAAGLIGKSKKEYFEFAKAVQTEISKLRIKEFIGRDFLVIQAISGLDDLNKAINMMVNRIREWHGLHYPEMKEEDHQKFLKKLSETRKGISMGIDLEENDLSIIKTTAARILEMYALKNEIEKYLETIMGEIAPNITALAGANLGARLIERGGSLKGLSEFPGSTIQVLGAEKALFKHLQKGSPQPKHGVIFQHPAISRAPASKRGRLARTLGAKLALAARIDNYSCRFHPKLIKDWEERVKEVME